MLMDAAPLALLRAVSVCLTGAAWPVLAALLWSTHASSLQLRLRSYEHELARDIAYLRLAYSARQVVMVQLSLCALALGALTLRHFMVASISICVAWVPRPWLTYQRSRRTTQLEEQLDGWLFGLASVMRATPAPGQAIEYSAALVPPPLRDELETLVKEQRLGTALDNALARMGTRIGSRAVQSALGTLRIGQASGGDIPTILERSAATLREMARLEGVVRSKTAESKAQASLLAELPFPLIALLHWIDPGFLAPLLSNLRGTMVIAAAITLWLASIFVARRILDVDL